MRAQDYGGQSFFFSSWNPEVSDGSHVVLSPSSDERCNRESIEHELSGSLRKSAY